ncbi:MAG: AAA family ATPase [Leptospiraceae bacterium]|nr:AAA family ATPase [Leptospiraceae bacterium]
MSVPIEIIAVIKELEIFGFKSFAAKTKVPFRHRITAVVGPNGCGKSNILDAMKWVLGEKSVKAIRGEKMEDVIFSGTETKKPANFAEVAVTLDNQNRLLDLEMDEVKIGRRLFRDGQSQYYLNDRKVARKDIEHLLFDTGVGKSSYSFMEQGRMDMILSSKPEERRAVFEEAAGISRYKAKKEEAERNLENARLNMTRLQDILRELERELKIKESQAEKTRQYNDLLSSRKDHDLRIRFFTLQEINTSLVDLDQKLEKKRAEAEKLRQKNLQVRERLEQIDEEKSVKTTELHQKDTGNQVARERIAQWEKRIEETSRRIVEQTGQAESMRSQLAKVEKRVKELRDDRSRQDQMTLQLNARLEDAQRALKEIDTNSEKLKKDIADAEKRQKENRQQLADNREKILEQRSELEAVIQDLLRSLKEEKKNWEKAEKVSSGEAERITKVLNEIGEHLASESVDSAQKVSAVQKLFNQLNHTSAIEKIAALPASLRHLLFEEGGIHSRKEQLDEQIIALEDTNRKLDRELEEIQNLTLELRERLAASMRQKETISGDIRSFNVQVDNLKEKDRTLKEQIGFEEASLQFHREQFRAIDKEIVQANTDLKGMQNEIAKLQAGIQKEIERIAALEKALAKLDQKRHDLLASVQDENRKAEEIQEAMNELEIRIGTLIGSREVMTQDIYNDFNLTLDEVAEKLGKDKIQLAGEKNKLGDIQKQIEALGPINALAIEELKTVQELHKHNNTQLQDILKARDDILSVIADIQSQSESMFLESFAQIENNFREVFRTLFKGGDTKLTLTEPDNPLESGIDISVKPPGKSAKSLRLLSGGEKALTAIALMFGIYMVRSSPFCILDEIDAPLDDQNVGRFLDMLTEFSKSTQFILITHNKKTMSRAHAIFGVTMEEPGVSRLLSVELKSA